LGHRICSNQPKKRSLFAVPEYSNGAIKSFELALYPAIVLSLCFLKASFVEYERLPISEYP